MTTKRATPIGVALFLFPALSAVRAPWPWLP
jgi:hypothetical protein